MKTKIIKLKNIFYIKFIIKIFIIIKNKKIIKKIKNLIDKFNIFKDKDIILFFKK